MKRNNKKVKKLQQGGVSGIPNPLYGEVGNLFNMLTNSIGAMPEFQPKQNLEPWGDSIANKYIEDIKKEMNLKKDPHFFGIFGTRWVDENGTKYSEDDLKKMAGARYDKNKAAIPAYNEQLPLAQSMATLFDIQQKEIDSAQNTKTNISDIAYSKASPWPAGFSMQQGGSIPTTQDSLDLYNNAQKVLNFYSNNKDYKRRFFEQVLDDAHRTNDNAVKVFDYYLSRPDKFRAIKNNIILDNPNINKEELKKLYRKSDPTNNNYRYYQRELANSILNLDSPMQLFDKRIDPVAFIGYNDKISGDVVTISSYEPLLVKPVSMLTDKERVRRAELEKFYGISKKDADNIKAKKVSEKVTNAYEKPPQKRNLEDIKIIDRIQSLLKSSKEIADIPNIQIEDRNYGLSPIQMESVPNVKILRDQKTLTPKFYENELGQRIPYNETLTKKFQYPGSFEDGGRAIMGYKDISPYKNLPFQTFNTDTLTMDGVGKPLIAIADNGQRKLMLPNSGLHRFPGAKSIMEIPVAQDGLSLDKRVLASIKKGAQSEKQSSTAFNVNYPIPKYTTLKSYRYEQSPVDGIFVNAFKKYLDSPEYKSRIGEDNNIVKDRLSEDNLFIYNDGNSDFSSEDVFGFWSEASLPFRSTEGKSSIVLNTKLLDPYFKSPTLIHEMTHAMTNGNDGLDNSGADQIILNNLKPFEDYLKNNNKKNTKHVKGEYDYLSDPTEVHARINATRLGAFKTGVHKKFGEDFTEKQLETLINKLESEGDTDILTQIKELIDVSKDKKSTIKLLNTVAGSDKKQSVFMAQDGGVPGHYLEDPNDSSNYRKATEMPTKKSSSPYDFLKDKKDVNELFDANQKAASKYGGSKMILEKGKDKAINEDVVSFVSLYADLNGMDRELALASLYDDDSKDNPLFTLTTSTEETRMAAQKAIEKLSKKLRVSRSDMENTPSKSTDVIGGWDPVKALKKLRSSDYMRLSVSEYKQGGMIKKYKNGGTVYNYQNNYKKDLPVGNSDTPKGVIFIEDLIPIQTEVNELILTPTLDVVPVNATKRHSRMDDDEVTDLAPANSYVFSKYGDVKIYKDLAKDVTLQVENKPYNIFGKNSEPKTKTLADFMTKKVMAPADLVKNVINKYKVVDNEGDLFTEETNRQNKLNRAPILEAIVNLSELDKGMKGLNEAPAAFKNGGLNVRGVRKAQTGAEIGAISNVASSIIGPFMSVISDYYNREAIKKVQDLSYRDINSNYDEQLKLSNAGLFANLAGIVGQNPTIDPVVQSSTYLDQMPTEIPRQFADYNIAKLYANKPNFSGYSPQVSSLLMDKFYANAQDAQSQFALNAGLDRANRKTAYFQAKQALQNSNEANRTNALNLTRANANNLMATAAGAVSGNITDKQNLLTNKLNAILASRGQTASGLIQLNNQFAQNMTNSAAVANQALNSYFNNTKNVANTPYGGGFNPTYMSTIPDNKVGWNFNDINTWFRR